MAKCLAAKLADLKGNPLMAATAEGQQICCNDEIVEGAAGRLTPQQPLTINTSRSPFLSRPTLLADVLLRGLDTPPLRPAFVDEDLPAASATAG